MPADWGDVGSGALSGAGTGAAIGSMVPGVGTLAGGFIGGAIGGISGWLHGDEQEKREEELRGLLAGEAYTPFGQTEQGMALRQSLMAEVNRQAETSRKQGLTTVGRSIASRGMLSSTVLPTAQAGVMADVERQKGMGVARVGQTMGGIEAREMAAWRQREFAKRLQLARYLQEAGTAEESGWGSFVSGATQFGLTALTNKYGGG